ncbi:hypothetical protein SG26_19215 (plasmid) [Haloarcula sp. CBA1115]|uniref:hypothetical protein n=1 Tax=unclassified Haloarcula TaxID=2624677 RepID=UPI00059555C6|nr:MULTISPECIES: hypothetical protein [unclassified Haloarcula]AJF27890.1 hypothetical protein SG26_19215 [Haloarcula sp. CBA1115]
MSDLLSAFEKIREVKRERHEIVQETPFELCTEIRDAGRVFRDVGDADEATQTLVTEQDIEEAEAERRLKQYATILYNSPENPHWAERFGSQFFDGESVEALAEESRFSRGEIERWIREYVGVHLQEANLQEVELPSDPPDSEILFESQREAYAQAASTLGDINFDEIVESVNELEASDFEFKWVDFLVAGLRDELYEIYQEKGEEQVVSVLSELLDDEETLDAILSQVDSRYLKGEREKLLKDAISAHNEGRYGLSIPTALTQIDGAIIEAATDLGIWELDDEVTGTRVVAKGEGSHQHISEFRDPFRDLYPRLMGRGSPRSKILHGIRTDFVDDEALSTKMIWLAMKSFSAADKVYSDLFIREEKLLDDLSASSPKDASEIATRFRSNRAHAVDRCESLVEDGYLESSSGDTYTITPDGEVRLTELRGY